MNWNWTPSHSRSESNSCLAIHAEKLTKSTPWFNRKCYPLVNVHIDVEPPLFLDHLPPRKHGFYTFVCMFFLLESHQIPFNDPSNHHETPNFLRTTGGIPPFQTVQPSFASAGPNFAHPPRSAVPSQPATKKEPMMEQTKYSTTNTSIYRYK